MKNLKEFITDSIKEHQNQETNQENKEQQSKENNQE